MDDVAIGVLLGGDSVALRYVCCACRTVGSGSGKGAGGGTEQLLSIVGSLVADIKRISEIVDGLQRVGGARGGVGGESVEPLRTLDSPARVAAELDQPSIQAEVRELYEREKSKFSVILRGLGDVAIPEAVSIFGDMCQFLRVGVVTLEDVVRVAPGVFRAVVKENQLRFTLLSHARELRGSSQFSKMYIQKDLTYRQR